MIKAIVFGNDCKDRLLRHGLFLLFIFLYYYLNFTAYRTEKSALVSNKNFALLGLIDAVEFTLLSIVCIYTILYFLLPRLMMPAAIALTVLIIFLSGAATRFIAKELLVPFRVSVGYSVYRMDFLPGLIYTLTKISFITLLAICIKFIKKWHLHQAAIQNAEQEKTIAQLQLLKSQIHPHFLFNTLNNIYSYALDKREQTPEMILKLSEILGYILYECDEDNVLLEKEIKSIENYISLEKLRYGNRLDLSFNVTGNTAGIKIAPMILLPLVENAFKHGVSESMDKTWVTIDLIINKTGLKMKVINPFDIAEQPQIRVRVAKLNGIGLKNIRQQLLFQYADKASLITYAEGGFFTATIIINNSNGK